jgi:hypothetical protein
MPYEFCERLETLRKEVETKWLVALVMVYSKKRYSLLRNSFWGYKKEEDHEY